MSKTWFKKRKCSKSEGVLIPIPANDVNDISTNSQRKNFDRNAVLIHVPTNNEGTNIENPLSQQETHPPKRQETVPNISTTARRHGTPLFSVADCLAMCIKRPATISPPTPTKEVGIETENGDNNVALTSWNESEVTTNDELHYNSETGEEFPMTPPPVNKDTLTECKNSEEDFTNYYTHSSQHNVNTLVTPQSKCGNSEVLGAVNTICSYNIEVKEPVDLYCDVENCTPSLLKPSSAIQAYYGDSRNENTFPEFIFCDSRNPYFISNAKPCYSVVNDRICLHMSSQSMSQLTNVTKSAVENQLQHAKFKPFFSREKFSIDTSFAKYLRLNINFEKDDIKESLKCLKARYCIPNDLKPISCEKSYPLLTGFQAPAVLKTKRPPQPIVPASSLNFKKVIHDARLLLMKMKKRNYEEANENVKKMKENKRNYEEANENMKFPVKKIKEETD